MKPRQQDTCSEVARRAAGCTLKEQAHPAGSGEGRRGKPTSLVDGRLQLPAVEGNDMQLKEFGDKLDETEGSEGGAGEVSNAAGIQESTPISSQQQQAAVRARLQAGAFHL